ncbi:hypothetical protein N0V90_012579 [Kalmusia sp. IMI 367209]|nr:hypothetical protein N0V90_012579 [Kalmusia sp. IMI 367209]
MSAEARKAYAEYMSGGAGSGNASQHQQQEQQQQQQQGQQPGSNFQNPYAAFGMQQGPSQSLQNPYPTQQYPPFNNPVYEQNIHSLLYTYPLDLSELRTALVPAPVPPAAPTPPPAAAGGQQLLPYNAQGPLLRPQTGLPGHAELQRSYNLPQQAQTPASYGSPAWQYCQPEAQREQGRFNSVGRMAPVTTEMAYQPRDWSYESTRDRNGFRYSGAWPPPDVVSMPSPPPANAVVPEPDVPPLALCHVCSQCGALRSSGYHRHHPIIPGHLLISTPCRRCKKKARKEKERKDKEKAKREEATKEPSKRTITIEIDDSERRGRTRARDVYEVYRSPSPRPRVVYRSASRANIGIRGSTGVEYRVLREASPEPSPPPVLRRRTRSEVRFSSVSPPPGDVRIQYRRDVVHGRPRSPSPDAKARLDSHPTPYRSVTPTYPGYYPEEPVTPRTVPPRSILKTPSQFYEPQVRHTVEPSYDSMQPEVGGNRVLFGRERREAEHVREHHMQCVKCEGNECVCDDDYLYSRRHQHRWQRGHVEELPPSPEPPVQKFGKLYVREESPPRRAYEEVRFRHVTPDSAYKVEKWREHTRRQSPPPSDERGRARNARADPARASSPLRNCPRLREVVQKVKRRFSRSPPPPPISKEEDLDDATDSGSDASGEPYWVEYRGVDENGRPATYIEKRIGKPSPIDRRASVGPPVREIPERPAISRGFAPVRDV